MLSAGVLSRNLAVGEVTSKHEFPLTEGYRPRDGYFSQKPECEKVMRQFLEDCAFKAKSDSFYFKSAAKMFPTGTDQTSTGRPNTMTYIGNVIQNMAPLVQSYNQGKKSD